MAVERRMVVTPDGRSLEVLDSGSADRDREAVVFHLGTPAGPAALPAPLDPGSGVRVVMYARPGYGRSTPQPGRRVADAARDTASILDALGIDTFVTVGWSGGGPHALACAALLPDRCLATAVIAGLAPYPAPVRDWTEGKAGLALSGDDVALDAACEADREAASSATGDDMPAMFPSPADRDVLTGQFADWLATCTRSAFLLGIAGQRDDWKAFTREWGFDLADPAGVMLWQGDQDDVVTPACARWLADHVPDSTLRVVSGAGHLSIGLHLPAILEDLTASAVMRQRRR